MRCRSTRRRSSGPGRSTRCCATIRACLAAGMLFRDKAMMKRRAQLADIPVGVFEGAPTATRSCVPQARQQGAARARGDPKTDPHKGVRQGGLQGTSVIARPTRSTPIPDDGSVPGRERPRRLGVRLRGVHPRRQDPVSEHLRVRPPGLLGVRPGLARSSRSGGRRSAEIEKLIEAFEIDSGLIHPECFLAGDGQMTSARSPTACPAAMPSS